MNTNQKNKVLSDTELNQLLQHASKPQSSADLETRLLEKLNAADFSSTVITFPRARKIPLWITAAPLAASLLLGIWLGTSDTASDYLPFSMQSEAQSASTDTLYNLTEDNLS